jgi:hypothetical protein
MCPAAAVTAPAEEPTTQCSASEWRETAMRVASQLVMFFKRPGGQMQFTRKGEAVPAGRAALQELQRWVAAKPALDHSVANLAKRIELSPRHRTAVSPRSVQSLAQSFVPLTVPTSLQPIGGLGFICVSGFPPTLGFFGVRFCASATLTMRPAQAHAAVAPIALWMLTCRALSEAVPIVGSEQAIV